MRGERDQGEKKIPRGWEQNFLCTKRENKGTCGEGEKKRKVLMKGTLQQRRDLKVETRVSRGESKKNTHGLYLPGESKGDSFL